jgi:hypothetical protein
MAPPSDAMHDNHDSHGLPALWGFILLAGGGLLLVAGLINMVSTLSDGDLEGDEATAFVFASLGGWTLGLGLLAAGALTRVALGARVALLIAGGFLMTQAGAGALASALFASAFRGFGF